MSRFPGAIREETGAVTAAEIRRLARQVQYLNETLAPAIKNNQVILPHGNLEDVGDNTHDQIDAHIANSTIHFTAASLPLRFPISFGRTGISATDYINHEGIRTSAEMGVLLPYAGSVVAVSVVVDALIYTSGSGTITGHAMIDGGSALSAGTPTISGAGARHEGYATQAAGISTFTAGQVLSARAVMGGSLALNFAIFIDVFVRFD